MNVGDQVKIERDEKLYPSKGSWPRFRGRGGTIVEVNEDRRRPHLTEYGVAFGKVTRRPARHPATFNYNAVDVYWFKSHEIVVTAPVRPAGDQQSVTPSQHTGEASWALISVPA